MTPDLSAAQWRTSRRTDGATTCVEVAVVPTDAREDRRHIAIRNSTDRTGPVLVVDDNEWNAFIADVRARRLDHETLTAMSRSGPFRIELTNDGHVQLTVLQHPLGPVLRYTPPEWEVFTGGTAYDGEFTLAWLQPELA